MAFVKGDFVQLHYDHPSVLNDAIGYVDTRIDDADWGGYVPITWIGPGILRFCSNEHADNLTFLGHAEVD